MDDVGIIDFAKEIHAFYDCPWGWAKHKDLQWFPVFPHDSIKQFQRNSWSEEEIETEFTFSKNVSLRIKFVGWDFLGTTEFTKEMQWIPWESLIFLRKSMPFTIAQGAGKTQGFPMIRIGFP